jgi:hypothetical protein
VFEIPCWNGDAVRVAFAIDSHDREVLDWTASPRGIGGIGVRDLMRFGPALLLRPADPKQSRASMPGPLR